MTTDSPPVTGAARIELFLAVHRQQLARLLLWLAPVAMLLALAAFRLLVPVDSTFSWTSAHGVRTVAELAAALIFMSLVFGAWKIVWFVARNPAARRQDAIYLLIFGAWVAYLGCGSLWLIATNLNQVL